MTNKVFKVLIVCKIWKQLGKIRVLYKLFFTLKVELLSHISDDIKIYVLKKNIAKFVDVYNRYRSVNELRFLLTKLKLDEIKSLLHQFVLRHLLVFAETCKFIFEIRTKMAKYTSFVYKFKLLAIKFVLYFWKRPFWIEALIQQIWIVVFFERLLQFKLLEFLIQSVLGVVRFLRKSRVILLLNLLRMVKT